MLGSEAEGNKTKEMNYYSLNLNKITFVLLPAASEPSMNFSNFKLASPFHYCFSLNSINNNNYYYDCYYSYKTYQLSQAFLQK